eukprot:TRINITY_DN203_c0_g1_i2.p1 TRINITY_DN203_c0_g1~~TRINITY_DN203_c0_g1_i2.p1  ORF type:complete len:240 (-),score=95.99 TRINITY_DN203_c0_g1_i2:150-791(-)
MELNEEKGVLLKERKEVEKLKRQIDQDREELENMYEQLRAALDLQNYSIENKDLMITAITKEVEKLKATRNRLDNELEETVEAKKKLAKKTAELEASEARFKHLEQSLDDKKRELEQFKQELDEAKALIKSQESEMRTKDAELRQWESQLSGKNNALIEDKERTEALRLEFQKEKRRMEQEMTEERNKLAEKLWPSLRSKARCVKSMKMRRHD